MECQVILKEGSSYLFWVLILINMCGMIRIKQNVLEIKEKQIYTSMYIEGHVGHFTFFSSPEFLKKD